NSKGNAGAVYVFVRSAGTWAQQAYVKASNPDAGDTFGFAVALSHDGNTLAGGAPGDDAAAANAGATLVFTRSGTTWTQQAHVLATDLDADDQFGASGALGDDLLMVGSPQ